MTTIPLGEVKSEIGIEECNPRVVVTHASANDFAVTNDHNAEEESSCTQQRPRSNSSLESADVQSVVAKAKRASASLWMLLHAKSCRLGVNSCFHRGCSEAKLVLLHIKTCPATSGRDCPANHNGCAQARKLLAHYDACREVRLRKVAGDQHFCLVCSLVARHARSVLSGNSGSNDATTTTITNTATNTTTRRARLSSFDDESSTNMGMASASPSAPSSPCVSVTPIPGSQQIMPPPPPRNPQTTKPTGNDVSSSLTSSPSLATAVSSVTAIPALCESPPVSTASPLMSVATVASLAEPIRNSEPDASCMNIETMSQATSWSSNSSNGGGGGLFQEPLEQAIRPRRRKRAETLDFSAFSAAQPLLALRHSSSLPRHFGNHHNHHHHHHHQLSNDPTLELGLTNTEPLDVPCDVGYESDPNLSLSSSLIKRPRSLSCSVMMGRSSILKGSCETIAEETSLSSKESIPNSITHDEPVFYMDEDNQR